MEVLRFRLGLRSCPITPSDDRRPEKESVCSSRTPTLLLEPKNPGAALRGKLELPRRRELFHHSRSRHQNNSLLGNSYPTSLRESAREAEKAKSTSLVPRSKKEPPEEGPKAVIRPTAGASRPQRISSQEIRIDRHFERSSTICETLMEGLILATVLTKGKYSKEDVEVIQRTAQRHLKAPDRDWETVEVGLLQQ